MIEFKQGDILKDKSDAIVNPVNCVGVMGKGLALQFKKAFPLNYRDYARDCKENQVVVGKVHWSFVAALDERFVVNFPTKKHWRDKSEIEYISSGLDHLIALITHLKLKSLAIPALGVGLGGLPWEEVKQVLLTKLDGLSKTVNITIYEPQ